MKISDQLIENFKFIDSHLNEERLKNIAKIMRGIDIIEMTTVGFPEYFDGKIEFTVSFFSYLNDMVYVEFPVELLDVESDAELYLKVEEYKNSLDRYISNV
jgi:hypothetical protein